MVNAAFAEQLMKYHGGVTDLDRGFRVVSAYILDVEEEPDEMFLQDPDGELTYIHDAAHLAQLLDDEDL